MVPVSPTETIVSRISHTWQAARGFFHSITLATVPCIHTFPTGSLLNNRSTCTTSLSSISVCSMDPEYPYPSEHEAYGHFAVLSAYTCAFSFVFLMPQGFLAQLKTVVFVNVLMNKSSVHLVLLTNSICYSRSLVFIVYPVCASWSPYQPLCSKVLVWGWALSMLTTSWGDKLVLA